MTIPLLRHLAAAASSEIDFTLVLTLQGAIFCAVRSDCFQHLRPEDIQDVSADRVRVVLRHLDGEGRLEVVDPLFERLKPGSPGSEFTDCDTPLCPIRLCPVEVFRQHRGRVFASGSPLCSLLWPAPGRGPGRCGSLTLLLPGLHHRGVRTGRCGQGR